MENATAGRRDVGRIRTTAAMNWAVRELGTWAAAQLSADDGCQVAAKYHGQVARVEAVGP